MGQCLRFNGATPGYLEKFYAGVDVFYNSVIIPFEDDGKQMKCTCIIYFKEYTGYRLTGCVRYYLKKSFRN